MEILSWTNARVVFSGQLKRYRVSSKTIIKLGELSTVWCVLHWTCHRWFAPIGPGAMSFVYVVLLPGRQTMAM